MKGCSKKKLNKYIDDEFSEKNAAGVQEHIENCPDCRKFIRELKIIKQHFRQSCKSTPPKKVWENIERSIEKDKIIEKLEDPLIISWPAVVALGVLIFGIVLGTSQKSNGNELEKYIVKQLSYYEEEALISTWDGDIVEEEKTVVDYFLEGNYWEEIIYE